MLRPRYECRLDFLNGNYKNSNKFNNSCLSLSIRNTDKEKRTLKLLIGAILLCVLTTIIIFFIGHYRHRPQIPPVAILFATGALLLIVTIIYRVFRARRVAQKSMIQTRPEVDKV